MTKSIAFWSDGGSGCEWYRAEMPAIALMERGHGVVVSNMLTEIPSYVDVVVGQRVSLTGATQGWEGIVKTGRYKTVYEIDDDLLYVAPSNGPAWSFFSDPEVRSNIKHNIQISDAVVTTNAELAERVSKLNPNVHIVPNCVPGWVLELPTPADGDLVTVGWGGGLSHAMDWAEAQSEVARFVARNITTEMHVMGWKPPELWRRLPNGRRRFTQWISSVPDLYRSIDYHVGLAPLRPHVFNKAKSYIKALEYAALGIPVIASDFGPYAEFVRDGETGFLVHQPHEWAQHLRTLLDPFTRREMGAKARQLAAEHTIERNVHLWEKALCTG